MQESGMEVLYYPGQLTGAPGRMHYKMVVVDNHTLHIGTANLSQAATRSLELGITIRDRQPLIRHLQQEIDRLHSRGVRRPPPLGL